MEKLNTVFMGIHTLVGGVIAGAFGNSRGADELAMQSLTEDLVTKNISGICHQHLILLLIAAQLVFLDQCGIHLVQHLTLTEAVKIEVTDLLFQRECFAHRFQEQAAGFIRLIHIGKQPRFVFFIKGVHIAEVQKVILVVSGLRHSADTTDGLDFKVLAHAFTQLHENLGTGTIPSCADGLFHEQEHGLCIILGQIVREVFFVLAHPFADHAVVVGVSHRFQLALHGHNGFRLAIWELNQHQRTDVFADGLIMCADGFALGIGEVEQIIVVIGDFHTVRDTLIHIESLGNQASVDDIEFVNLEIFVPLVLFGGGADTHDVLCRERINDGTGLGGIVGMLLVNDDDECDTLAVGIGNAVKQIFALTVPDGRVALFGDKFPVDESCAFRLKAILESIEQILRIQVWSELPHFLAALFFQIALTGTEPDEGRIGIDLVQIFIHKINQHDGFAGACGSLHDDGLLAAAIHAEVEKLDDGLLLKIE